MTRVRNSHGMMLGIVIVVLVLLMFGTAAVALLMAASWRSTLRVDADTEAANVLASAINIVDALATGRHDSGLIRTPEDACIALHTNYTDPNMPVPPPGCPTGPTDWTRWMPLPGRDGCVNNVLEGCWRARFAETAEAVQVTGRTAALAVPVWTITLQAAARCDALPGPGNADELCVTVTGETALTVETVTLPVFPSLLYSGHLWPADEDPDTADCVADPPTAPVWCAIPAESRPAAGAQVQVSASVAASGIFVNDLPGFACSAGWCVIAPGGADDQQARTVQGLPPATLADESCTTNPAVIAWTWPSGVVEVPTSALPADMPPAGDPQIVVATGNIRITDNIDGDDPNTPELEALLIVSGCHIIIGECVMDHYAYDPNIGGFVTTETEADSGLYPEMDQCEEPNPADYLTVGDPVLGSVRLASTNLNLRNVIIVAAGGLWAADLSVPPRPIQDEPVSNAWPCHDPDIPDTDEDEYLPGYHEQAPKLRIVGSVITGHAGGDLQTARLRRRCLERPRETRRRVRPHQRAAHR